jgi:alkaline phosphatase D
MKVSRRTVLAGLAASLAASGCGVGASPSFPLGVATGDVSPNSALLWTKYTRLDALQLRVWPEIGDVMTAPLRPVESVDGFVLVELKDLLPGQWHRFQFESADGEVSPLGRFRTALAPDALETVTFGATSCIKAGHSYAALGHASRREDLDAFIFLGDTVYTDGAFTLDEYREKWTKGLKGDDYQALRGSTSLVSIWDDHEVRNNWQGDDVDAQLLDHARRAFLEHQPLRRDPINPDRFWRSLKWGRTAEIFVLDGRSERVRSRGEYLSKDQLDWVLTGVNESDAVFKLVINAVPIGSFDSAFFAPFNDDNWQVYPEQRSQLLEGLEKASRTMIVSGDFHLGCFGRCARSGPGSSLFEALVGPGANAPNPLPTYPRGDPYEFSTALSSYSSFELNPDSGQATVRYHAGNGRTLFERTLF